MTDESSGFPLPTSNRVLWYRRPCCDLFHLHNCRSKLRTQSTSLVTQSSKAEWSASSGLPSMSLLALNIMVWTICILLVKSLSLKFC